MNKESPVQAHAGKRAQNRKGETVWALSVAALAILHAVGCGPNSGTSKSPPPVQPPRPAPQPAATEAGRDYFRDVTAASGLDFTYRNGEEADHFSILESLGGGVGLIDYDGDGLLDIFLTGGGYFDGPARQQIKGHACRLFRNLGDWKFADVSKVVGLEDVDWWYTHGVAVADYDRDGWPDLLVTGFGRLALFHNVPDENGGRRFVDVTEQVGLAADSWSTSAAWGDVDGDGYPDLYVAHYVDWSFENHVHCPGILPGKVREVCSPSFFKPLRHAFFHNEQGKSFRDDTVRHVFQPVGAGLGALMLDLNDDARPDILATNDMTPNLLYFNRGGKLEEKAAVAGIAVDEQGRVNGNMGVDAGDFDGSGRASLWVTVFQNETHVLARNLGQETFQQQSRAAGIAAVGQHFVSFGTGFIDFDNDGWEDLFIVSGHVFRFPPGGSPKQRPLLLRNEEYKGRRTFRDTNPRGGPYFETRQLGRGVGIADIDNDGWPDLIVSHTNSPVILLRNQAAEAQSPAHHWIGLQLVGREHRDTVGSTVVVESDGRRLTRFSKGGGSYLSSGDRRLLFGVADSTSIERVTVKWAWGETQTWENLAINQYWELHENETNAKSPSGASR